MTDEPVRRVQRDAARLIVDREILRATRSGEEPILSEEVQRIAWAPLLPGEREDDWR